MRGFVVGPSDGGNASVCCHHDDRSCFAFKGPTHKGHREAGVCTLQQQQQKNQQQAIGSSNSTALFAVYLLRKEKHSMSSMWTSSMKRTP